MRTKYPTIRPLRISCVACLFVCLLVALLGCESLVSDHLIGEPLEAELVEQYTGVWRSLGGDVFYLIPQDDATLLFGFVEWDDEFRVATQSLMITTHHDTHFLWAIPGEDQLVEPGYANWVLVGYLAFGDTLFDNPPLLLYLPNYSAFTRAVEQGLLEGEVNGDVHIQGDKSTLDAFIEPGRLHELFELDLDGDPGVFIRLRDANY